MHGPDWYEGYAGRGGSARHRVGSSIARGDHQAGLVRDDDDLGPVSGVELRHRSADMRLDRQGLMYSAVAISSLLMPVPTRASTSRSRSVREESDAPSNGRAGPVATML